MNISPASIFLALLMPCQLPATHTQSTTADASPDSTRSDVPPAPSRHRYRELSFYIGQTLGHPKMISDLGGQGLLVTGLRMTSHLFTSPHLFIAGNVNLQPLALHSIDTPNGRQYTYGGGGSLGLQFAPRVHWRWRPFFDVDGGLLCFPHDIPVPDTRRVNMTLAFGPGFLIPLRGNKAMRAGFWYFHFSNGNTGPRNPGFDGFLLYVAYTYRNFVPFHSHKHPFGCPRLRSKSRDLILASATHLRRFPRYQNRTPCRESARASS